MNNKLKSLLLFFIFLTIITVSIYRIYFFRSGTGVNRDKNFLIELNNLIRTNNYLEANRVIIFIDMTDLSCPDCEGSLLYICNYLNDNYLNNRDKILLLVKKRKRNLDYYEDLITTWISDNDIKLNIKLDLDNIFKKANIKKTSIVILDKNNNLVVYKEFPLSRIEIDKIINIVHTLLKNNDHTKNGLN